MKRKQLESMLQDGKRSARSAWRRGVYDYAQMILDGRYDIDEFNYDGLEEVLLNGARDWNQYSWGGNSCIYDSDIAEILCTPSELKRRDYGRLKPNAREEWLDVQARALFQAFKVIRRFVKAIDKQ